MTAEIARPEAVWIALGAAAGLVAIAALYRARRRYATVDHVPAAYYETKRYLTGIVVSVGDGDNFRLAHTPWLAFFRRPTEEQGPSAHRTHSRTPARN